MKKTTFTSNEQGRSTRNWKEIIYSVSALCLFLIINPGNSLAQGNCVMACFNTQVSVDENCEAVITFDMVSTPSQCSGNYVVEVLGSNGLPIPTSPMVNYEHIGLTLTVKVMDVPSGNHCWSTILVEDKMPPVIECTSDTMSCWQMIEHDIPFVYDNCTDPDDITVTLLNETITSLACDPDFIKTVTRSYVATDASGNQSSVCEKVYYLERIDMSLIEFPDDLSVADGTQLSCDGNFPVDGNGHPHPSFSGVPTLDGIDLYPISGDYCNILVTYHDVVFPNINCKDKIIRTWTVREWWCSQEIVEASIQVIEITDEEGPDIVCPADLTVTTSPQSCSAGVFLAPAIVSDNCNDILRVDVTYPGGFLQNSNGGFVVLPVGDNLVTYTAYDECLNSSSCSINVLVEDKTPPIAVCKTVTVVALSSNGLAEVFPTSFDNGSHDECGIDYFEVARMTASCGYGTQFGSSIEFSCCDIPNNNIQVILRVFDTSGNSNECMVEVEVQDKLPAAISCPPDITISCQFTFDPADLSLFGDVVVVDNLSDLQDPNLDPRNPIIINDPDNPNLTQPFNWGLDGFAYDNCAVSVTESDQFDIDQCGVGTISRIFTADGPGGPSSSCVQTITVENYFPFSVADITWPDDVTIDTGVCDPGDLDPDITGRPILNSGFCDLVGINTPEDEVFVVSSASDPSCFKIIRTWKVVDWCQQHLGVYTIWEHKQTIKIKNTNAPEFTTDCEDIVICSFDPNCSATFIELRQEAIDDCTPEDELRWTYQIDAFNNGVFDFSPNNNPFAASGNAPNEASGSYPVGTHRIVWTVEDQCGNKTTCTHLFEIQNCTQPKPVCYHGLAAETMPMDLSGDGEADWAEIELHASMFDAGSSHSCGYELTFSFSSDPNDQTRLFDCDSLGQRIVEIWVTDEVGNQDLCITYVIIQDNNQVCPDNGTGGIGGSIAGMIVNSNDEGVEDVEVSLVGSAFAPTMTSEHGFFAFPDVPMGKDYQVVPQKNDNPLNGVTTYDIALIQRHILGIQELTSPYSLIAADVANNGNISVIDVAELRRLILGTTDQFSNNASWRFIDGEHNFNSDNPLTENFPELVDIFDFNDNLVRSNFVAVKVGDVNNSAITVSAAGAEERSFEEPLSFLVTDQSFQRGEMVVVPFYATDFSDILGFQGTVMFDPATLELIDIKGGMLDISDQNFGFRFLSEGLLTASWSDPDMASLPEGEKLFELIFTARESGKLSDLINMGSTVTTAEIYEGDNARPLELKFDNVTESDGFVLFQNRPNPFRDETVIGFRLPQSQYATLTIYDVTGKLVYEYSDHFVAGYNELTVRRSDLNVGGVLYYRLDAENFNASRKMIIID